MDRDGASSLPAPATRRLGRVALDYRPALYSRSGIARAVRELGGAMAAQSREQGLDLRLFAHGWREPLAQPSTPVGGTLHRRQIPSRSLPALAALGLDACRLSGGAELFHWTDYVYPPVRRGRRRPRVVLTVHDLAFLEDETFHGAEEANKIAARFSKALARSDLVLCPSEASAAALRRHVTRPPRIRVIPFGADHARVTAGAVERGRSRAAELCGSAEPYLVVLGTLEPRKNHEVLLDALDTLAERGRPLPLLVVGGRGWCSEGLHARLATRALRFPCVWTGAIEDAEVFDLVAGARGLVYPSSLEGFGFPPMEALELGVPVLAGDCAALREHLGEAAFFAEGRDAKALSAGVLRLVDSEAEREATLRAWSRRRHAFRWARSARAHLAAYASLLGAER